VLVSHRYQFIFIKSRKTAGTSLEIALSMFMGPDDVITRISRRDEETRRSLGGLGPQNRDIPWTKWRSREWKGLLRGRATVYNNHFPAERLRRILPKHQWNGYFKFTIDRNPWDLAVSAYYWRARHYEPRPTFQEYLRSSRVEKYSNWPLYTAKDRVIVDKVIRYEQLPSEVPALATRLGLPSVPELPRAKSGHRPEGLLHELYGEWERERVAQIWRREIEAFAWEFPPS